MIGNKLIAIIAAMIAGGTALAVAALYLDRGRMSAPPAIEQAPATAGDEAPSPPAEPQTANPAEEPETKQAESPAMLETPPEPTTVPTFDVVVIQPSGEGVIAGRAAPGWKVSVQSGGSKVAEAKADVQGEWSVVLEKPLPSGDHALSLKITSPDGTRAVSSQETVRVAVGNGGAVSPVAPEQSAKPVPLSQATAPESENVASQSAPQGATPQTAPPATAPPATAPQATPQARTPDTLTEVEPNVTRALARAEREALAASSARVPAAKPALVFRTVDYELGGDGSGTITITGASEPGAVIAIYYGKERLAETRADREGKWRAAVAKTLGMGEHSFRAERVGAAPGSTVAAVISIERAEPTAPDVSAKDVGASGPAPQVATVEGPRGSAQHAKDLYVIRRGDTLWAIAKRYLGSGLRYTAIFQDNREIISNPNLIHPQQEVQIPHQ